MISYVYLIQRGYGAIKIGVSDNPESRLKQLQTGAQERLRLIAKFPSNSRTEAFNLEKDLHDKLAHHRLKGEWFHRRILREMKVEGRRVIGGSPAFPLVRTINGWKAVE
jgi:predicted GIY-YIG superfamily endonuclease